MWSRECVGRGSAHSLAATADELARFALTIGDLAKASAAARISASH
jgi:hypothetical protein